MTSIQIASESLVYVFLNYSPILNPSEISFQASVTWLQLHATASLEVS